MADIADIQMHYHAINCHSFCVSILKKIERGDNDPPLILITFVISERDFMKKKVFKLNFCLF